MSELTCVYCNEKVSEDGRGPSKLHRDHIVPRARGGKDEADNSVNACAPCNMSKSDMLPSEWKPTGLPDWVYRIEGRLAARYSMKPRTDRTANGYVNEELPDKAFRRHDQWQPHIFHTDPMVNAVMNVAQEIGKLAAATDSLLYGLKYSRDNGGLSVAEAIEVGNEKVAEAISGIGIYLENKGS